MGIKIEAFLGEGEKGTRLKKLLMELKEELKEAIDLQMYEKENEIFHSYGLKATPALVIEGLVKIQGICPSKETILKGLKEVGLG
uniref:Thioredoxin-like fold domain-containing protein n=1 Tax=candidate division WOR-3 bacterium TaxID=2052148 RepID=A0A7C2P0T3_UNCW3